MTNSERILKQIKEKFETMSIEEKREYLKEQGFKFDEQEKIEVDFVYKNKNLNLIRKLYLTKTRKSSSTRFRTQDKSSIKTDKEKSYIY